MSFGQIDRICCKESERDGLSVYTCLAPHWHLLWPMFCYMLQSLIFSNGTQDRLIKAIYLTLSRHLQELIGTRTCEPNLVDDILPFLDKHDLVVAGVWVGDKGKPCIHLPHIQLSKGLADHNLSCSFSIHLLQYIILVYHLITDLFPKEVILSACENIYGKNW